LRNARAREIVNELVDWFNKVDATYKSELRELNELNYARFDAKLEQRIAELRSEIAQVSAHLERRLGEQTRWFFVAWATQLIPIIGLWMR
jgi:uncharacterized small protein (DUF1192 family)